MDKNSLRSDLRECIIEFIRYVVWECPPVPSRCVLNTLASAHITCSSWLRHWYCEGNSQTYHHLSFHSQFHQASLRIKELGTNTCQVADAHECHFLQSICWLLSNNYPLSPSQLYQASLRNKELPQTSVCVRPLLLDEVLMEL